MAGYNKSRRNKSRRNNTVGGKRKNKNNVTGGKRRKGRKTHTRKNKNKK